MNATKLFIVLCVSFFIGCSYFGIKPHSYCDSVTPGDSLLCDLATENDLNLETIGNMIMLFNFAAIEEGLYDRQEAIVVLEDLKKVLDSDITGEMLVKIIKSVFSSQPLIAAGGVMVISPYLSYLDVDNYLLPLDKQILNYWLDSQIELLRA